MRSRAVVVLTQVAGVDGYSGGWFAVLLEIESGEAGHHCVPDFAGVIGLARSAEVIAVDMPIGLLDRARRGGRRCDLEARRLLGPRAASIFTPAVRGALAYDDYADAAAANKASSTARISISRQSFGLLPRLRELDAYLAEDPSRQQRIREVHPELSFCQMNNQRPLPHGKKSHRGFLERLDLLRLEGMTHILDLGRFDCDAATDDVLDAYACCYTAVRIVAGKAIRVPDPAPRDSRGLQMEIWR